MQPLPQKIFEKSEAQNIWFLTFEIAGLSDGIGGLVDVLGDYMATEGHRVSFVEE